MQASIAENIALGVAGIPDSLIILEDSLSTELAYLKREISMALKSDHALIGDLKEMHFKTQQIVDELKIELGKNNPVFHEIKYSQKI